MTWTLQQATTPDHYRAAVELFKEYAASLDFGLDFQNFDDELEILPTMYGPPTGRLYLVALEDTYVGCVGLRRIENEYTCEIKRMYLRPDHRGLGIGKALLTKTLEVARQMGYKTIKLDTIGYKMPSAVGLYQAMGFRETAPYNYNPYEGVLYFEKELEPGPQT
ncbi:N-acetyltransferase [Rhabdobacter roseus]|uniref:GNAT superfamily N-acetyltransferase n=1 Tax=Rhabdobacter roseus TaxID=1655419 RepID=A0A840TRB3_9BACT|nr:GNAT family N-acetyltransferase [Rhabdobacter roseus]MBB5283773.1 GNAT superfamily N-acetyltransferase [Rhabdobacter roseus]